MQYELFFGVIAAGIVLLEILTELSCRRENAERIASLKRTDLYIANVRHYYFRYGSAQNAIAAASGSAPPQMRAECAAIEELLSSSPYEIYGSGREVLQRNRYLRIFTAISALADEDGDQTEGGSSVYAEALTAIRLEIAEELRSSEERHSRLRGLSLTAGLPILAVPVISEWCVNIIPTMSSFYMSRAGALLRLTSVVLSLICYAAVVLIREDGRGLKLSELRDKRIFRQGGFLTGLEEAAARHIREGSRVRSYLKCLNADHLAGRWFIFRIALTVAAAFITFVISGIGAFEEDLLPGLPDIVAAMVAGILAYCLSFAMLAAFAGRARKLIRREAADCRMLVRMQYKLPGMDVLILLRSMEQFTELLRPAFRRCISEYSISVTEALEKLSVSVNDHSFKRLTACLIAALDDGVETAFGDIAADVADGREMTRHENKLETDRASILAGIPAVLPGGLILIGYLILPFIVNAVSGFAGYSSQLTGLLGGF